MPDLPDSIARTDDTKSALQNDTEDAQAEESSARNDIGSNIPLSGRKRAHSDPGDVKRPSTAGTDRRMEILARETLQDPYSSTATAPALEERVDPHLPPPISQAVISPQAHTPATNAFPAYMSLGQPVSLEDFSYGAPAGVSFNT